MVTPTTIARWAREAQQAGPDELPLARPTPPVRRFADGVRALIQLMDRCGIGGNALIARTLLRVGWRVSPETVRRIRRERPPAPPPVAATTIPGLFRATTFHLALVFDGFARFPIAWRLFTATPKARHLVQLLRSAITRHGRPRHLISDRGRQFTATIVRRFLGRHGIRQRFGAVGRPGSIALIERVWRTLKARLRVRTRPPFSLRNFETRLTRTIARYATVRPHSALDGATPLEIYRGGRRPVALRAPPRGRRGEGLRATPFTVAFLDPDRTLPILIRRAA